MQPTFLKATIISGLAHSSILAVFFFLILTPTGRVMVGEGVVEVDLNALCCHPERSEGSPSESTEGDSSASPQNDTRSDPGSRIPDPKGNPTLTAIWKKINRAKYYPLVAREQKLEGAPRVQFQIGEDGKVTNISLVDSSGSSILDDAALETIRRAAPLPSYPELITLAIRYSLTD